MIIKYISIILGTTFEIYCINKFINIFSPRKVINKNDKYKFFVSSFNPGGAMITAGLFELVTLIALGFCVFKIFFDNIKRGGILLIQLAVGSLYMFSIPRGYGDGFNNWVKQVFALCLTAFLQTTLLFLGLLSWSTNMLLAIGIMMSAAEVPRIAQQFGLDNIF